jgi:hypothetical protein
MFMRFRGGGVGHKSFQKSIKRFCDDRWPEEKKDTSAKQQADITEPELEEDVPEITPTQPSKCEVDIELADSADEDSENASEQELEVDLDGLQSDDELDGSQGSECEAVVDEGEPEQATVENEIQDELELDDDELEYADF